MSFFGLFVKHYSYLWFPKNTKTSMTKSNYILVLLCLFSFFLSGQGERYANITIDSTYRISFLVDSSDQITFSSIHTFQDFQPLTTNIRVKPQQPVWVKLELLQDSLSFQFPYISVGNFDRIEMYDNDSEKLINGRLTSLEERVFNSFPIHFPLSESQNTPIFFKVSHENPLAQETIQVNLLTTADRNSLLDNDLVRHNKAVLLTGGIIGLFFIFLFFSAMAFIFTSKQYYIYYTLYIIANLIFLLISAERFSNLDLILSNYPDLLVRAEPLLLAVIGISYNLFLKKFIARTQRIKWLDIVLTGFIIYELLLFVFDPILKEAFQNSYFTYKLHEIGLLPMIGVTLYFLFNLFKTGNRTLRLIAAGLFILLWVGPILYVISPLGENQTFFLNPNMPFHLLMVAELIFFTLILTNEEYQSKIKQEKEKSELKNQLSGLEKSALQAQMNPHFIFNCLNSIQSFIIKNEKKKAVEYLSKFARLVRHNLNASVEGEISVAQEVDLLESYLALEKQRFSGRFNYAVTVSENFDATTYTLPPLLIQPYVENAVLHGLEHKETDGLVTIDFSVQDNSLRVKIKDNGIGYKKSENQKKTSKHKSVGMSITHRRLELFGRGEKVMIRDLSEANPPQAGTEVIVNLKLTHNA